MNEQEIKEAVADSLRSAGFEVVLLAARDEATPDLLATKGRRFLIEIKTKEDDPAVLLDRRNRLDAGEVAVGAAPFTPQNTISRIIKKGSEQLAAYPSERSDFRLLWLLAVGADSEGQYEQFRATLYGLTNVVGPDDSSLMPCYCLRHSAFYRWRDVLDGAVISTLESGELCLNSYSPRYAELRGSVLGALFGQGIVDPQALEQSGAAYIADCDVDRNDETAVLQYLLRKYQRPALIPLNLGSLTAYVEVPSGPVARSGTG